MSIVNTPYFELLRARLDFLSRRQSIIAENLANASTPGFTPRDVDENTFVRSLRNATRGGGFETTEVRAPKVLYRPDSETTLDGNSVVLEDQSLRAADTRASFELGLTLYQKGLAMLRTASKPPGR